MAYEAVIGLECHVQLRARSKMFCGCPVRFGAEPNSNVCPVCLGLPGALPRVNRAAVEAALRLGLALGCAIHEESVFARKSYFYPDLPKGYQITQYDRPLCEGGALPVRGAHGERRYEVVRLHLEEDAGKSLHGACCGEWRGSRVDFNRAGVPLLELVTGPVLREPAECAAFLGALRRLVRWLGISDGEMEKGHLRCDANVSLRPAGTRDFGVKTELKNLNSIRGVERGLAAEIARQRLLLETVGTVKPATLLYDVEHDRLAVMRSKEGADDYRYFPEPDLPVLRVEGRWLEVVRAGLPELPWARVVRLARRYGLTAHAAAVLCEQRELADYYESCASSVDPKLVSNWVMREVLRVLRERHWTMERFASQVPAGRLGALVSMVAARELPGPLAKQIFAWMLDEDGDVQDLLARHGAQVLGVAGTVRPLVLEVLAEHPGPVARYRSGRAETFEFFVGQVMKKSGGQAAPDTVRELLREELGGRSGSAGDRA